MELGLTPAVPPLGPGPPPRARRPPAPAAAPFVPPASCQAGVRALNAGEGPADGYHRWSVEIGRIGLSHRPFLRAQQKPPNKSTKIPKITKKRVSFVISGGGGGPAALLLACTRVNMREVTRLCVGVRGGGDRSAMGPAAPPPRYPLPNPPLSPTAAAATNRDVG